MKIKSDFITNSSSTNYLIFIPDGFDVSKFIHIIHDKYKTDIIDIIDIHNIKTIDEFNEKFTDEFNKLFDIGLSEQYCNPYYYLIVYLLNELGLLIDEMGMGTGDNNGFMWNINSDKFKDKVKPIRNGGWGLTHGGWGHESKE